MIKQVNLLLIAIVLNFSCIQKKNKIEEKTDVVMKNEINSDIEKMLLKPIYGINFSNLYSTCQFEIFVNDVPVFKFLNQRGGTETFIPINIEILRSGKQKVKIKLYPSVVKEKLMVSNQENSPFELSISQGITGNDGILKDEKVLYELPFIPLPKEGLPYWETEIEFEAEVPYEFIGWSRSKDLSKIDDIEEKVFKKFEELQKILTEKNTQKLLNVSLEKNKEIYTSLYLTPEQVKEREGFMEIEKEEEAQTLENSIIKFYGEGRLVTLENPKDGKSALRTVIKDESGKGKDETITYPMYLHIPENSNELEIIR